MCIRDRHNNRALYLNRGLFSPGVWFFRENNHVECSVITCAAPNKSAAQKYQNVSDEENTKVLRSRIKFVLDMAKDNNVNTLISVSYTHLLRIIFSYGFSRRANSIGFYNKIIKKKGIKQ